MDIQAKLTGREGDMTITLEFLDQMSSKLPLKKAVVLFLSLFLIDLFSYLRH